MSADAAIAEFVAAQAEAWGTADVDTIADAMGLPQMLAGAGGTTFIEEDDALVRWIEARLATWAEHGVVSVEAVVEAVEDLPDDAARVTSRWTLTDGGGATVVDFVAVDTLAADDGDWYLVVTDIAGEEAAWAGRS